jgi:hypothetical protein
MTSCIRLPFKAKLANSDKELRWVPLLGSFARPMAKSRQANRLTENFPDISGLLSTLKYRDHTPLDISHERLGAGIEEAASAATTQALALKIMAMWKACMRSTPDLSRTCPSRAIADSDPTREMAPLNPDAVAAYDASTDVSTSVVIGANTRLTPSATRPTAGRMSAQ